LRLRIALELPLDAFSLNSSRTLTVAGLLDRYASGERDFRGVQLTGPNFANQDLSGANFRRALLPNANFKGANLVGCNFREARLASANFAGRG